MKTTLRLLTTLLLCMILCCCLSAAASAETVADGNCGAQGDNLTWTLDDAGTLTIYGEGEMANYNAFAPWYSFNYQPESVKLKIEKAQMPCGITDCGFCSFHPMGEL